MKQYTKYSPETNTLYINSNVILPNTVGMSWRERCKAIDAAFNMEYDERIKEFCPAAIKDAILAEIAAHPGCTISEYMGV